MCNSNQINFFMMEYESIHSILNLASCIHTFYCNGYNTNIVPILKNYVRCKKTQVIIFLIAFMIFGGVFIWKIPILSTSCDELPNIQFLSKHKFCF